MKKIINSLATLIISSTFVGCTTYGSPGLTGGVKSQWRADDKLVVVTNVNLASSIAKGGNYATEMSLFHAANEGKLKGYTDFCPVTGAEEQLAMELRGEFPVPAKKGMAPKPSSDASLYKNTIYIMTNDNTSDCGQSRFSIEDVITKYSDRF